MSFLHPEFLYYMLLPLVILFGLLLTQKESQAHFFSKDVMERLRVSANTMTLKARNVLFMLIGFLMILALAQPVIKEGTVAVKAKSADIMIALDISDSMLATDVYPNRLESAKQKALTLLGEAPNERIGIVAFAKDSYLVSPLSFDTSAVAFLLRQLDTSSITEKGTDLLSVLNVVSKAQKKQKKKYLLILSDGGDKSDFSKEIEMAKKSGIRVFVLGVATRKGAPIKLKDGTFVKYKGDIIVSKLNEKISELATKTGGVYIQSTTSSEDIKTMLREITNVSDQKELKSEEIQRHTPLFYYPVALALLILLIATSSARKRESVNVSLVFVLLSLISTAPHAEAGMLDFIDLKKAKEAYSKENYEESAKLYKSYAKSSNSADSYYNAANAYYKQKKYKEAIESYKKASFSKENKDAKAKNLSNMGNAYVKEGAKKALEKAIDSYEKSLKIKEDKETRENLQEVKKLLKKQKQKSKDKNSDKKKDKDKKGNKNKDSKDGDKKKSDEKKEKSSDDKNKSKDQKDSSKSKASKDKEKNSDDMKSKKESDEKKEKSSDDKKKGEKKKKDDLKELKKDDKKDSKASSSSAQELQKQKMSETEEKKWIQQLNNNNSTYMYRLSHKKSKSENSEEKPW